MPASAGYKAGIFSSVDGITWTEIDGIKSASMSHERDVLDITDFKTLGIDREKIQGLRNVSFSLSGDFVSGDPGQEIIRTAMFSVLDNPPLHVRFLPDGVNGFNCKVIAPSGEFGAEVEGLASFSASLEQNGTFVRVP
jgi:predicted secreted protein